MPQAAARMIGRRRRLAVDLPAAQVALVPRLAAFPKGFFADLASGKMAVFQWIELAGTLGLEAVDRQSRPEGDVPDEPEVGRVGDEGAVGARGARDVGDAQGTGEPRRVGRPHDRGRRAVELVDGPGPHEPVADLQRADRARLVEPFERIDGAHRPRLGEAVTLDQGAAGDLLEAFLDWPRQRRAARDAELEARDVVLVALAELVDRGIDRRHAEQHRGLGPVDDRKRLGRLEAGQEDELRAEVERALALEGDERSAALTRIADGIEAGVDGAEPGVGRRLGLLAGTLREMAGA